MIIINDLDGRSGRARTCDPRFWRPVLYQLSYTPAGNLASPPVRAVSSIGDAPIASPNPLSRPVHSILSAPHSPSNNKNKGRAHERAACRPEIIRPADAVPAPGQAGGDRALDGAAAKAVGCVQARGRQRQPARADRA